MLTISGGQDYYSPYPTLTALRGRSLRGPDAISVNLAAYYRKLAKRYGVTLPNRPADLTAGQAEAADILEGIEIAGAELVHIARRLFRMLAAGGAPCSQLLAYNRLAMGIYELQREFLAELRQEGVPGVPLAPPWPPLFVGFGLYAAAPADSFWEINCESAVVQLASDANPDGMRLMLDKPCDTQLTGAGLTVLGILAASALIYGLGKTFIKSSERKAEIREAGARHVRNLECMDGRTKLIEQWTNQCVGNGGTWAECNAQATESAESMDCEAAVETAELDTPEGGASSSWLWWIGLGTVLVGGYFAYRRWVRPRVGPLRGAELIGGR